MPSSAPSADPSVMPAGVTTAFTWIVEKCVGMIEIVVANPVLCLGIAIWAAGGAIGLFKRLV